MESVDPVGGAGVAPELRSLLAKAEERASDERSRCDRLVTQIVAANARAEHLEGEWTALRAAQARPWWLRLGRGANRGPATQPARKGLYSKLDMAWLFC